MSNEHLNSLFSVRLDCVNCAFLRLKWDPLTLCTFSHSRSLSIFAGTHVYCSVCLFTQFSHCALCTCLSIHAVQPLCTVHDSLLGPTCVLFSLVLKLFQITLLVRWSLHKYKCLWGVGGKGQDSSFQEGVSHTYTLRLG